jgi:phage terminase small subunit
MSDLNDKQLQFCREFIIDLNATQAAIRAGYSPKSANQQGSGLLANPKVSAKIAELKQERCQETKISANWVLEQSKKSYEFNAQEVFDSEGNPKMVNATAASKFLEMCGKHVDVKAFEKEALTVNTVHNIMPVPQADNAEEWEKMAQANQDGLLHRD